jgi:hypothetical protein
MPDFAGNRAGFAPKPEYRELPEELSSRDLYDAFNRTIRDGVEHPGGWLGGTVYTITSDGVSVDVHKPSGHQGSVYGISVRTSSLSILGHAFTLENGVRVQWEKDLNVHRLRGILQ